LYLEYPDNISDKEAINIVSSKRINIDYAGEARDYLWRYTIENNEYVSVKDKKVLKK
jgi:DNA-3-methyladenine glycosylase